jgi:hypothetical protein
VPEPRVPEMGGSSPKCSPAWAICAPPAIRQNPRPPASRSTPHRRGQHSQCNSWSEKCSFMRMILSPGRRKFQIPSTKFQTNSKHKISMPQTLTPAGRSVWDFGHWNLFGIWDLVLGISALGRRGCQRMDWR